MKDVITCFDGLDKWSSVQLTGLDGYGGHWVQEQELILPWTMRFERSDQ